MIANIFRDIKDSLRQLYLEDERPWLVGFSGGKDSTMLASLVFDVVLSIPLNQRKKPVSVVCTDTRVEIPAIADMIEGTLDRMRKCSLQNNLNVEANLLKPTIEESFWVNIIGRGYPPPNRTFRWCTQRMKIDPVNVFVKQRIGHSDDQRIESMFDILMRAGERVQIIVLTCRKRLFTRLGAATLQIQEDQPASS